MNIAPTPFNHLSWYLIGRNVSETSFRLISMCHTDFKVIRYTFSFFIITVFDIKVIFVYNVAADYRVFVFIKRLSFLIENSAFNLYLLLQIH